MLYICSTTILKVKVKVIPQQAEVAQGVPGGLRLRIFLTFGTTRVVGLQRYAPAAFTPGEIPGTHFQGLSRPQGTWFRWAEPRKKIPSDTRENRSRNRPTLTTTPPQAQYNYIMNTNWTPTCYTAFLYVN